MEVDGVGGGGFGTNDFFRGVYRYFLKQLTCVLRLPEAGCYTQQGCMR